MSVAPASTPATRGGGDVRVLIADDSAVVRGLVTRWLEAEPGIVVAGVARNGKDAVEQARRLTPDVIILDVEMPELDGLSALPLLLAGAPRAKVLMSSTLTRRNAEVTLKALSLGAADYLAKPEAGRLGGADAFRMDLVQKIRALGGRRAPIAPPPLRPAAPAAPAARQPTSATALSGLSPRPIDAIVVGSSTGGPNALQVVLPALAGVVNVPILVVQHMPPTFTAVLAEHLARRMNGQAGEARDGEPLKPGYVHIAPGDRHLRVERKAGVARAVLDASAPVNFCRPAVDPLFESAAEAYGARVLGCVLTGMGADGRAGAQAIVAKGGAVIAQDEATSVVWGMPGAVAQAGLAAAIKPLDEIGPALAALANGRQR